MQQSFLSYTLPHQPSRALCSQTAGFLVVVRMGGRPPAFRPHSCATSCQLGFRRRTLSTFNSKHFSFGLDQVTLVIRYLQCSLNGLSKPHCAFRPFLPLIPLWLQQMDASPRAWLCWMFLPVGFFTSHRHQVVAHSGSHNSWGIQILLLLWCEDTVF